MSVAAVTMTGERQAQGGFLNSQPQGLAACPSLGRSLDGAPAAPLDQDLGVCWCTRLCQPSFHHGVTRHEAGPEPGFPPDRGPARSACTWMQFSRTLSS